MIEFKCHCAQPISVADDQAGGLIQCPRCGRLNDVPTLSDLRHLDADGNFQLTDLEIVDEPERLHKVIEAFGRKRVDEHGEEIDLRPTLEEVARAGVEEIPITRDEVDLVGAPKYDPLTGELIEPLKIKREPTDHDPGAIPMATAVLGYAGRNVHVTTGPVWLALLMPVNLLVMSIVFFGYIAFGLSTFFFAPFAVLMGIRSLWLGMLCIAPLLAAHFVNVISEMALEERDELPRPLRNLSWGEDIWGPFVQIFVSTVICFGPLAVWSAVGGLEPAAADGVAVLLLLGGSLIFPAVLLTLVTSGSLPNLRPDRLTSVLRAGGATYAILFAITVILVFATLLGFGGVSLVPIASFRDAYRAANPPVWVSLPLLLIHLYLAHYASWTLGLMYRGHQREFKWVMQSHQYRNRTHRAPVRPGARGATLPPNVRSKR